MGLIVVGIGEYRVSAESSDVIKTYALGSCVAVMIYDKVKKIAGMIHIALPESSVDAEKARSIPGHFADTGLPLLIEEMKKMGVIKPNVWVKIAGGASVMDEALFFDIGKRNTLAVKKVLWKSNLGPISEDTGLDFSRTVTMSVGTGEIVLSSGKKAWNL
jgi:chemotaxis protein CheD